MKENNLNVIDYNEFHIKDARYKRSKFGHIMQVDPKPFIYDKAYNQIYDSEAYKESSLKLCSIRYRLLESIGYKPNKLLDFGYGNGAFLDYVSDKIEVCNGFDIASGYTSEKWSKVDSFNGQYDVITFWDSLEHVKDLTFLKALKTKYIAVSLPYAHLGNWMLQDFETWKHRKPNEHLHHFNLTALVNLFNHYNYKLVVFNTNEDEIRKPEREETNILSCLFVKSL